MDLVTNNYYDNLSTLSPNGSVAPLGCCSVIGCGSGGYPVVNTSRLTTKNLCLGSYSDSSNLSGGLYNIKFTDTNGESWPLGSCQKTVSGVPHYPASVPGWNVYSDSACGEDIGVCYVTCTPNGVCNTPGTVLSQAVSSSVCDGLVSVFQSNNPECNCVKGGGGQFQVAPEEVIPPVNPNAPKVLVPGGPDIVDRRDKDTIRTNQGRCYRITVQYRMPKANGEYELKSHTGIVKEIPYSSLGAPNLFISAAEAFRLMRPEIPAGALELQGDNQIRLDPEVPCDIRTIFPSIRDLPYKELQDLTKNKNFLDPKYSYERDKVTIENYTNTLAVLKQQILDYNAQIKKIQDDEIEWRRRYMEIMMKRQRDAHRDPASVNTEQSYGWRPYWKKTPIIGWWPGIGVYSYKPLRIQAEKWEDKVKELEKQRKLWEDKIRDKEYVYDPMDLLPEDIRGRNYEMQELIDFINRWKALPWEYNIIDNKRVKIRDADEMREALEEWNEKIRKNNERIKDIKDKRAELKSYKNHGNRAQFAGPNAPIIRDTI